MLSTVAVCSFIPLLFVLYLTESLILTLQLLSFSFSFLLLPCMACTVLLQCIVQRAKPTNHLRALEMQPSLELRAREVCSRDASQEKDSNVDSAAQA